MFERRLPPEYEVTLYQVYERELLKQCELRRLAKTNQARPPSIGDQLLIAAGNRLIAFGERLRARSVAADRGPALA
jgi:hypothetical protein